MFMWRTKCWRGVDILKQNLGSDCSHTATLSSRGNIQACSVAVLLQGACFLGTYLECIC